MEKIYDCRKNEECFNLLNSKLKIDNLIFVRDLMGPVPAKRLQLNVTHALTGYGYTPEEIASYVTGGIIKKNKNSTTVEFE